MLPHDVLGAFRVPAFLVVIGMEHGNEVIELAATQRIVNEVRAWAGPQHHVGPPQILRHFLALEHRAIGDVAGDAWLAVANDALANARPHAVAAEQRRAFGALAAFERDGDAVAMVFVTVDAPAGLERDQIAALAGFEERGVDVGAVRDRVRLAEARGELIVEGHAGDQLAGQGVAHFLRRRVVGVGQDFVLEADFLQHAEDIRPELDAGADFAEFGRLLEDPYRETLARQRVGGSEAADTAAGNQDRSRTAIRLGHNCFHCS